MRCALMALDLNVIPAVAAMAAEVKSCSCTFSQVKSLSAQPSGCLWLDAACERSVNSLAQIIKQLLCAVCCRANYKTAGAQIAELSHSHSRPLQLLLNCSSSCRFPRSKRSLLHTAAWPRKSYLTTFKELTLSISLS